jgi:hypothetical protein
MNVWLTPRDPLRLLSSIMQHFAADATYISFEGGLSDSMLLSLEGIHGEETPQLRRATAAPRLDFLVAPLSERNLRLITQAAETEELLAEEGGLIHVQIATADRLVFGAYDQFHPNCTFVDGVTEGWLRSLQAAAILGGFTERDA